MQKTAAASCRRKMAGMPHMNFFFWVLCRMHRMVTYMAAEPPRADRVQAVYDAGYEEWILWNASNNYHYGGLEQ